MQQLGHHVLVSARLHCLHSPSLSPTILPTVLAPDIACREPTTLQCGHGCDGIDNTCDPDKQIDECEEYIIPPEIDASEAVSFCSEKIYTSADALECFEAPGLVTATDDCKEVDLSFIKTDAEDGCSTTVHIKAEALGCGKRPEEDTTVLDVNVSIDEDPPKVECKLLAQDLTGTGAFTDLGFWFPAVDGGSVGCTATEDLAISIKVYSNEVVETGKEMLSISTPLPGIQGDLTTPAIWAEDHVCKSATYGQCKIPSPKKLWLLL